MPLSLALLLACAAPAPEAREAPSASAAREHSQDQDLPPETDIPYADTRTLIVGGLPFRVEGNALLGPDGAALAAGLYEAPAAQGNTLCAAHEGRLGEGQLMCWRVRGGQLAQGVSLAVGGRPDRAAVHGENVAWVASPEGIPQVFIGSLSGTPARALTNVNLVRVLGQAPVGFVPPPHRDVLHFEGDELRWQGPNGPQAVRWR